MKARYRTKKVYRFYDTDCLSIRFTHRIAEARGFDPEFDTLTELVDTSVPGFGGEVLADFYDTEMAQRVAQWLNRQDRLEAAGALEAGDIMKGLKK